MGLEADVIKSIKIRLDVWRMTGVVLWWERLQSGTIHHGISHIKLSRPGTPDFVCVVRNKLNCISIIFFEAKRSDGKGKISTIQAEFRDKYLGEQFIHWYMIDNPKLVDTIINDIGIDLVSKI